MVTHPAGGYDEPDDAVDVSDALAGLPGLVRRASTAERAAEKLRRHIAQGRLLPGIKLREERVARALGISRNTVREAFRLLDHERLVEHSPHRGVFVRVVGSPEIRAMYATRRLVEPLGVDAALADPACRRALRQRVDAATAAAARGDWTSVGTADIEFHRALVGSCGSLHLTVMFEQLLAELRLAFLLVPDPAGLHEPYVARNRRLVDLLDSGDQAATRAELLDYLDTAEQQLLAAMRTPASPASPTALRGPPGADRQRAQDGTSATLR